MTRLAFTTTIFAGATLLFSCQPIIARMIVPLLGGAPSVWIVCSLCFQTLLLAGYGYVHAVGTRLPVRAQVGLQLTLVAAVFLVMPVGVDEGTVHRLTAGHPTLGLLLLLLRTIGLPFFVLSTSSPLLQRWFAELGESDPYHLYAASNAGSMIALLGYPLVLEPLLTVRSQSRVLHAGFAIYTVLVVVCVMSVLRPHPIRPRAAAAPPPQVAVTATELPARPSSRRARWRERLVWIGLSFAPSSLLLGATEYVTTDIASVPLLWVFPLALYLMSFIVAFAKLQPVSPRVMGIVLVALSVVVAALLIVDFNRAPWLVAILHCALLFVASVVCHRKLAERRPHVSRLTEFYLLMSIGGMLGGAFNGLLAPYVFDDLYEYPIAIGLVCLGRASFQRKTFPRDVVVGVAAGIAAFAFVKLGTFKLGGLVLLGVAALWWNRPVRFAVALGGLLLVALDHGGFPGSITWADRGFFGVLKVVRDRSHLSLVSGRALEGQQALAPEEAHVPLGFYRPNGAAGHVLGGAGPARRVGVIGLGIGSLAAYARPGDAWTFFEINPAVVDVARGQFSFLARAESAAEVRVEMGDARLRLREGPSARFDVLVLDAFASDAIPVHLVTREALAVYRRALRPGGLVLANVSNEHVHLAPVFGALAREAGIHAVHRKDEAAEWVLLAETKTELEVLYRTSDAWHPAPVSASVWTDDYANVLGALSF